MVEEKLKKDIFIPLSYDLIFKKVFSDEKDKKPLKYLLKLILDLDIKDLRILNNEILGDSIKNKKTAVDLIVELENGMKIGIEINRTVSREIIDRNLIYMFKIMGGDLRNGEDYNMLDKHIQINFDMEGNHEKPIERFKLASTANVNNILSDKLEIIRIDVPYFTRKCYNLSNEELTEQDRLIGLIGMTDRDEMKKVVGDNDIMKKIMKKVEDYNKDEEILGLYDYDFHLRQLAKIEAEREAKKYLDEGMKKIESQMEIIENEKEKIENEKEKIENEKEKLDAQKEKLDAQKEELESQRDEIEVQREKIKIQREKVIQQGMAQEKMQTAKNMLKEKIDIHVISKVTGLTISQIEEI